MPRPIIVSASYRTDIPAFYGAWFLARLAVGWAEARNPYGGRPARIGLRPPQAAGFVFWTRNPAPFADGLAAVDSLGLPFVVQMTITGLPRALEAAVPGEAMALAAAWDVARRWGPDALVWRYDPIVLTDRTPLAWHVDTFARLAAALEGASDEVVTSFVVPYAKSRRHLAAVARADGPRLVDPHPAERAELALALAAIAARHGLRLTLCTQPDLAAATGLPLAACVDAGRLSRRAGRALAAPIRGNRPGCLCALSRDIGAYDTCPQGCAYCYAVANRARARAAAQGQAAEAARLGP